MAGVGTLLKQAQKMQRAIESAQALLEAREIEVTSGGGAIRLKVSGSGRFTALALDPEFLREPPAIVSEALLAAIQEAAARAKELNDSEMKKATAGFQAPGLF
jgi:DNA-binding protein YbaB